jgi:hypothetical protein
MYLIRAWDIHAGLGYTQYKLLAVPTARVARMLAPLASSTGLSLLGALPPNPHPSLNSLISLLFLFSLILYISINSAVTCHGNLCSVKI